MVHIKKGDIPQLFSDTQKRYKTYDILAEDNVNAPTIRKNLKDILIKEQGGICAYCMVSIDSEKSTIEHYVPRNGINGDPTLSLDYGNMLAVCNSSRGMNKANQHCDVSKGHSLLNIDPRDEQHIAQVGYKNDGSIYSENPLFDKDLNEVLNLNLTVLKNNRKSALNAVLKNLSPGKNFNQYFRWAIDHYSENNVPYVGIIRWMLNKKQEQLKKNT